MEDLSCFPNMNPKCGWTMLEQVEESRSERGDVKKRMDLLL